MHWEVSWGLTCEMDVFGSEGMLEECGNWLSRSLFPGFVKLSEVRGAEELLNYLVR